MEFPKLKTEGFVREKKAIEQTVRVPVNSILINYQIVHWRSPHLLMAY